MSVIDVGIFLVFSWVVKKANTASNITCSKSDTSQCREPLASLACFLAFAAVNGLKVDLTSLSLFVSLVWRHLQFLDLISVTAFPVRQLSQKSFTNSLQFSMRKLIRQCHNQVPTRKSLHPIYTPHPLTDIQI